MSETTYYTKDHEWLRVAGDVATVGITDYAQSQLGDVVYVEVPAKGRVLNAGGEAAIVESVKAASDVFAPVSGEVLEANEAVVNEPSLINSAPESDGWFFRLKLHDVGELKALMDHAAYQAYLKELA